jgi:hypothetical protein
MNRRKFPADLGATGGLAYQSGLCFTGRRVRGPRFMFSGALIPRREHIFYTYSLWA